ncbi:MAG TPA: hypothetical protein VFZ85_00555 [Jiangellaceae bacterium]
MATVKAAHWVRLVINVINMSTALGLALALAGRARLKVGPGGLLLGYRYRIPVPPAPAFTLGNVVLFKRGEEYLDRRPRLLIHEARHATQYAFCLGPVMLVLYAIAAGWSWLRTGDLASRNVFEVRAGLVDGGYLERPLRPVFRRGVGGEF